MGMREKRRLPPKGKRRFQEANERDIGKPSESVDLLLCHTEALGEKTGLGRGSRHTKGEDQTSLEGDTSLGRR